MVKSLSTKEQAVEAICGLGCQFVNQLLASKALQAESEWLQPLNEAEQQWVLSELNSVMSVYSHSGSCSI